MTPCLFEMLNIPDAKIEGARRVLADHVVEPLNREGALESLLFCIASQAIEWERASKFIYALREASHGDKDEYSSWEVLTDKQEIAKVSRTVKGRFSYADRFDESIDYFGNLGGTWWEDIANADKETRDRYCENKSSNKIKWISNKTFSFWNLCLGGHDLLALDVHILRGLALKWGVEMDENYYIPKPRGKSGQMVRKTPPRKDYLRIENVAKEIFSQDERFLQENGKIDFALVDSLLWWEGANRTYHQGYLFGSETFKLPYSKIRYWEPADPVNHSELSGVSRSR